MDEEQIKEIEEDLGEELEDFEEHGETFSFRIGMKRYEGCEDEDVAERLAREQLEDYPEDVLGLKGTALDYFDRERFVNDCMISDGWQHTLCRYDGDNKETKNGIVYWRA